MRLGPHLPPEIVPLRPLPLSAVLPPSGTVSALAGHPPQAGVMVEPGLRGAAAAFDAPRVQAIKDALFAGSYALQPVATAAALLAASGRSDAAA